MNEKLNHPRFTEPEVGDPPTITLKTGESALALPYLDLKVLRLEGERIEIHHPRFEITISGERLVPLWERLRRYEVLEVARGDGGAGATYGPVSEIEIHDKDEEAAGAMP